jgi:hypothetical protein
LKRGASESAIAGLATYISHVSEAMPIQPERHGDHRISDEILGHFRAGKSVAEEFRER